MMESKTTDTGLLASITEQFEAHRRGSSGRRGRYPAYLRSLVFDALRKGLAPSAIREASGLSFVTISKWKEAAVSSEVAGFRRMEIQEESHAVLVFPSGLRLELPGRLITSAFILEMNEAA